MTCDSHVVQLLNFYRDAELQGAKLLFRLMKSLRDDSNAQAKLTLHVADETRHAWLWTKRIIELGGRPAAIRAGYQSRISSRVIPHTVADLLALTIVVEERSLSRYREHAARPYVDDKTRDVLAAVTVDESWHVDWITAKLAQLLDEADEPTSASILVDKYRRIEEAIYVELLEQERRLFGPFRGGSADVRNGPEQHRTARPTRTRGPEQ
jgi:bacterioferritin (cytochrome b1)